MVFLQTPLITDTRMNSPKLLKSNHIEGLLMNTVAGFEPVQIHGGIIIDTKIGSHYDKRHVPVIHQKTQPKRLGMIPYPGKQY